MKIIKNRKENVIGLTYIYFQLIGAYLMEVLIVVILNTWQIFKTMKMCCKLWHTFITSSTIY